MDYPFVSVVIPAKNEEIIIGKCLSALRNIYYPADKYEIILVDNGSTDKTIEIAGKYNVKCVVNYGQTISTLRNYGASLAKGEIIAFIDADVVVSRRWMLNAINVLNSEGVGCTGCSLEIPPNASWVERIFHLHIVAKEVNYITDWIASANFFVKKKVFDDIQGFNESMKTCEDVDICYRIKNKWNIVYDSSISAIHYGDIKNIYQFFNKESWRGIGNFNGIKSHGIIIKELPSHLVSLFYFMFIIIFPISIIMKSYYYTLLIMVISLIMPIAKAITISIKINKFRYIFPLIIVWFVYGLGRGYSVWRILSLNY